MHMLEQQEINLPVYARLIDSSVSVESMDIITKVPEFFTKKLSSMVDFFKGADSELKTYDTKNMNVYFKELYANRYKLNKAIPNIDYGRVRLRKISVTVGLDTNILEMTSTLRESNRLVSTYTMKALDECTDAIVRLVSDKEYRLSSRPIVMNEEYIKAIDTLSSNLSKVLTPTKISDMRKVGDLAPSIPHIEESIELALEYSNNSVIDMYNKIQERVNRIKEYGETLYDELVKEKTYIKKQRVIEISRYLELSANLVTQTINTLYLSNQSVIIINNLVTAVTDK